MSPVGHTLTGLAIGYLAVPRATPLKPKLALLAMFAVAANAPDLPFPYWGHERYDISHSVFSTAAGLTILLTVLVSWFRGRDPVGWRILLGLAVAWYSHLLLDTLYAHGHGLAIYWPLNNDRIAVPLSWLGRANRIDVFSLHNVRVAFFELITFGPLLVFALLAKAIFRRAPQMEDFRDPVLQQPEVSE